MIHHSVIMENKWRYHSNHWITLLIPRRCFINIVSTPLISMKCELKHPQNILTLTDTIIETKQNPNITTLTLRIPNINLFLWNSPPPPRHKKFKYFHNYLFWIWYVIKNAHKRTGEFIKAGLGQEVRNSKQLDIAKVKFDWFMISLT